MGLSHAGFQHGGQKTRSKRRSKGGENRRQAKTGWSRRQGKEEEVVQGKSQGQAEQLDSLRQGYIRQALQRGAIVQADHAQRGVWEAEGARLPGQAGSARAVRQRPDPPDL